MVAIMHLPTKIEVDVRIDNRADKPLFFYRLSRKGLVTVSFKRLFGDDIVVGRVHFQAVLVLRAILARVRPVFSLERQRRQDFMATVAARIRIGRAKSGHALLRRLQRFSAP